jgi:hypothetical protein
VDPAIAGQGRDYRGISVVEPSRSVAQRVLAVFTGAGYDRVEPAVLQPADIFLDLSGEDLRRRMFVTADASGADLALRPEYTIPVARDYLAAAPDGASAALAYCGPVFRQRVGETGEFAQAGIESFGRDDAPAADAEILALAIEAVAAAGVGQPEIRLGDVGLFTAVLDALGLPSPLARRLRRAFAQGSLTGELLAALGRKAACDDPLRSSKSHDSVPQSRPSGARTRPQRRQRGQPLSEFQRRHHQARRAFAPRRLRLQRRLSRGVPAVAPPVRRDRTPLARRIGCSDCGRTPTSRWSSCTTPTHMPCTAGTKSRAPRSSASAAPTPTAGSISH